MPRGWLSSHVVSACPVRSPEQMDSKLIFTKIELTPEQVLRLYEPGRRALAL